MSCRIPPALTFHPFMRLPPELRVRIYDMVVVLDRPILLSKNNRRVWYSMKRSTTRSGKSMRPEEDENEERLSIGHSALAVVHTCRQVYLEAAPRYYCLNTFAAYRKEQGYSPILEFSVDIGPRITEMIAKLELCEIRDDLRRWEAAHLKRFKGCRTLTLPEVSWIGVPSLNMDFHMQKWFASAKRLCKALKKLERVRVKPISRYPKVDQESIEIEQVRKAAEVELNLVLHARKQVQE